MLKVFIHETDGSYGALLFWYRNKDKNAPYDQFNLHPPQLLFVIYRISNAS